MQFIISLFYQVILFRLYVLVDVAFYDAKNIQWWKGHHVHAIVCFGRAHEAMRGAFNLIREELKYPHSSAVCVGEAVVTAAAISGPLPIKIRNRDISSVSPSTRTYHTLASSKLFNEAVIDFRMNVKAIGTNAGLASVAIF